MMQVSSVRSHYVHIITFCDALRGLQPHTTVRPHRAECQESALMILKKVMILQDSTRYNACWSMWNWRCCTVKTSQKPSINSSYNTNKMCQVQKRVKKTLKQNL